MPTGAYAAGASAKGLRRPAHNRGRETDDEPDQPWGRAAHPRTALVRDLTAGPNGVASRPHDVVVFGATGFTGRLVAACLQAWQQRDPRLRWAIAGRQPARLAALRSALDTSRTLPILCADASDPASLARLAQQTRVLISTVGPYERHGEPLVMACAEAGTDYVDLCGEPLWMARMIPLLEPRARASGARIVFSCGFDSVPFDLGVVHLQHAMQQRLGAVAAEIRAQVRWMRGQMSGGTVASALATYASIATDAALAARMADPFALVPQPPQAPQPDITAAAWDDWSEGWTGPFLMAPINVKNVHRTHALRGFPWGPAFRYSERQWTGHGVRGAWRAHWLARQSRWTDALLASGAVRGALQRWVLPRPGDGPDEAAREGGGYELWMTGETADGRRLRSRVIGQGDPGYASTSRMVTEAALGLLRDVPRAATPGGVWTPGAALGLALQRRLQAHAGLRFEVDDAEVERSSADDGRR